MVELLPQMQGGPRRPGAFPIAGIHLIDLALVTASYRQVVIRTPNEAGPT